MMLLNLRCGLYVRRSREEHQEGSVEVQTGEGRAWILREGGTLDPAHVFVDGDHGRAEFKRRPGLLALLAAAERRAIDAVVVRDESRLGGDALRVGLIVRDLIESGTRVFYYYSREEVRLGGAVDNLLLMARNFGAEWEREKIAQRTHEHLLTKARRGLVVGGRCYGYDQVEIKEGDRRLRVEYVLNETQAAIVREIFKRYAAGEGLRAIAKALNVRGVPPPRAGKRGTGSWSTSAIWAMLRRERYAGVLVWGKAEKAYRKGTRVRLARPAEEWVRVERPDLRIVDESTWHAVQARARRVGPVDPRGRVGGRPPRYMLTGFLRCAECSGPVCATRGRDGTTAIQVYTCAWRRSRGETVCNNTSRRPVAVIDRAVIEWIGEHVLSDRLVRDVMAEIHRRLHERTRPGAPEVAELRRQVAALRAEIARLVEAIATSAEAPAPIVGAVAGRQARLDELEEQLRQATAPEGAVRLELRRIEEACARRLADFRALLAKGGEAARKVLGALLAGPLRATAIDTPEGRRWSIEGATHAGWLLAGDLDPNSASPAGSHKFGSMRLAEVPRLVA